jgi:hypothetical protein
MRRPRFPPSSARAFERVIRTLGVALCAMGLAACQRQDVAVPFRAEMASGAAGVAGQIAPSVASRARRANESLAYEHVVSVEISKELLPTRMQEIQDACNTNKELACSLLDFSTSSNESVPRGSIRMRLAPTGVSSIVELSAKGGEIVSRNTHAEDLAEPIADTERELALLTTHRDRLAEFMKSKDIKVEQLITVSRELASAQSQIDSLSTQRANLRRRVDTELLTINLSLPRLAYAAEQSPVLDAFRSFGADLKEAMASVIRFTAFLLPWLVVIVPGLILLRLFWRWITRWLARRELRMRDAS